MVGSFLSISMWSAISAFIGTMILIYSAIVVLRLRGVQIWGAPPPSPASVVAALSDEDKEKIEKLRSSAILRHLNKYTTVSNFLSLFDTHLNISHDDYSSFLPFTIYYTSFFVF